MSLVSPPRSIEVPRFLQDGCALLLVAAALLHPHGLFHIGWIPHDEGLLALSAQRVAAGELPHLDFQDAYSGGLSALHALAFRVLGPSTRSLRNFHLLAFHAFQLSALWAMRRQLGSWPLAALGLFTLSVWTAPNYPASMPSWYVAYLGFAALALCLHLPSSSGSRADPRPSTGRLIGVGALAGCAFAIKLTGIYLLPAAAISVWAQERGQATGRASFALRFAAWSLVSWLPALLLVRRNLSSSHALFFVAPLLILALGLAIAAAQPRIGALIRSGSALAGGFALGSAPLLLWYASRPGGLAAFVHGVFIAPSLRVSMAALSPPRSDRATLCLITLAALVWLLRRIEPKWRLAPLVLAGVWVALGGTLPLQRLMWIGLRLTPLLFSAWLLWGALRGRPWAARRESWALASFAGFMNLTQFPYAFGIYLLYCVPFFLGALQLMAREPSASDAPAAPLLRQAALLGGLSGFALLWVNTCSVRSLGVAYRRRDWGMASDIARLGIDIDAGSVAHWQELLAQIRLHSAPGQPILAFPDTPETYFLSDRASPVPWVYDFFGPLASYTEYVAIARKARVNMLVVNLRPEFSRVPTPRELADLHAAFPRARAVDDKLVMWRDQGAAAPGAAP